VSLPLELAGLLVHPTLVECASDDDGNELVVAPGGPLRAPLDLHDTEASYFYLLLPHHPEEGVLHLRVHLAGGGLEVTEVGEDECQVFG